MANLLDLSPDEFMFTLQEFGYSPERRDELIRQYREHNSVFGALNRAAQERQAEIAGEGRRPVAGGFLSKPEGSLGMDAVRGLRVEPMAGLLGMLTGAGRAVEAPAAAYQGLIPIDDIPLEALGTAGMASLGGAAMTRPAGSVGMGGRVADGESRAQTVARLLREGRQSEVTDDLLATLTPNDNAELFRLYNEGETGMDLPMDDASRMARAEAAGFDTGVPLYHGTGADFQSFDPARFGQSDHGAKGRGVYTSQDPDLASSYATLVSENGRQVYPLSYGLRNPYAGEIPMSMYDEGRSVAFTQQLKDAGFDGVMQPNPRRGGEYTEAVAFDPRNIRSRFARFDPRLSGNANLLAANRDQTVGLLSTAAAAEPRNAAERMARDILDMRAAGRAGEVTDEMMAQADPQYMFANTPLPMDEASRMARAGAAGLVDDQYHATMADFPAFLPSQTGLVGRGVYSGDFADGISDYARAGYTTTDGLNIIPIVTPSDATYARRIDWQNTIDADDQFPYNATPQETVEGFRRAADNMSAQGLSGVRSQDGERVTFNPRNIRSRFARFDPEFSHLANLNAANIDPLAGLFGALAAEEQRRQRNSQ